MFIEHRKIQAFIEPGNQTMTWQVATSIPENSFMNSSKLESVMRKRWEEESRFNLT
jgi:hypothetical protein